MKSCLFVRSTIEPPGSSGSARRPAQPTPDFAQGVAPREKAIAASLALSLDVEYLPRGMRLRQARTPSKTALECVLG